MDEGPFRRVPEYRWSQVFDETGRVDDVGKEASSEKRGPHAHVLGQTESYCVVEGEQDPAGCELGEDGVHRIVILDARGLDGE